MCAFIRQLILKCMFHPWGYLKIQLCRNLLLDLPGQEPRGMTTFCKVLVRETLIFLHSPGRYRQSLCPFLCLANAFKPTKTKLWRLQSMKIDRKSDILGGVFLDLSGKRAQRHANDFASFLQEKWYNLFSFLPRIVWKIPACLSRAISCVSNALKQWSQHKQTMDIQYSNISCIPK